MSLTTDPLFRVELLTCTPNPQTAFYQALHQDYSSSFVADATPPSESEAGEICVKRLLNGKRNHWGPLEHAMITLNAGWFPHSVMVQARTHRIGTSMDCQSMRYTSGAIIKAANAESPYLEVEQAFYLRQPGDYTDRQGARYTYTAEQRAEDLQYCWLAAKRYASKIDQGWAEEHARGLLPSDYRQHFVFSFSLRAILHFFDMRSKLDAQSEIRQLCDLMWPHVELWVPEIAAFYRKNNWGKALLSP